MGILRAPKIAGLSPRWPIDNFRLCTALRVDLPRFLIALRMARVGVPAVGSLLALRSAQEIPETRLMGTRCETLICCMLVCDAFEAFSEVIGSFIKLGLTRGLRASNIRQLSAAPRLSILLTSQWIHRATFLVPSKCTTRSQCPKVVSGGAEQPQTSV